MGRDGCRGRLYRGRFYVTLQGEMSQNEVLRGKLFRGERCRMRHHRRIIQETLQGEILQNETMMREIVGGKSQREMADGDGSI